MNGHNRHMQYRRSVYRRRRIRLILILLGVLLVLLLAGFLIVGNLLNNRASANISDGTETESSIASNIENLSSARAVCGYPVILETPDSTTLSSRLSALKDAGIDVASVPLNKKDGQLLYRSPLATELNISTGEVFSVTLSTAVQAADSMGIYISGTFYLTAFSKDDDLIRSVSLSRDAALLTEAFRDGVDDVLLIAPSMTAEHIPELVRMIDEIRSLYPKAILGLALPDVILSASNADILIDGLAQEFNYLSLNTTETVEEDPSLQIEEKVNHTLYYLLRYQMRVLLPQHTDPATQQAWISAVENNGIKNWQILSSIAQN